MSGNGRQEERLAMRRALFERLDWQVAERDDAAVARAVYDREELGSIYNLDQGGLLDGFMAFLGDIGFLEHLSGHAPEHRQRVMVPACLMLLTYMMKSLLGIEHLYAVPDLLFSDPAVMKLMGFNARWLEEGLCERSHEKRAPDKEAPKPFCPQMVANFLAGLDMDQSVGLFRSAIRCLERAGFFPEELFLITDGTDIETTEACEGAGRAVRKEQVKSKTGTTKVVEVVVHGFKAIVAFERSTQIPVGLVLTPIEAHESPQTRGLIDQVKETFKESRITKLLVDRGFLDGATLWWLDEQGIDFVVPGKSDMWITKMARAEAKDGREKRCTEKVVHGRGKSRRVEEKETVVVGVANLPYLDSYNDPAHAAKAGRRGYKPKPLNAVVVRSWDGHANKPGHEPVLLTNMPVDQPLSIQADYDGRSLIENTLFREGKQAWSLENIPQKNAQAAFAHVAITLMMVALTTAYRIKAEQDDQGPERALGERLQSDPMPVGIRRWRRRLREQNRDYVIVFCGTSYGIFHVAEFSVIAGFRIKEMPPELGTREAILTRYGLPP